MSALNFVGSRPPSDDALQLVQNAASEKDIVIESTEESDPASVKWYYPRQVIDHESPSRLEGMDLKQETYYRRSYCTFLQDVGMRLRVPQVTIATAIVFCHRFFLRHSHVKNDRYMIATVCMFLAGKVEETPRPLKDLIMVAYEVQHKKGTAAAQRIKEKAVYEAQREMVLVGERLLLTTLGFDLNIFHPYRTLVGAIKKFGVAQNALAQVAWNFVNDGLRTSLCLQFRPHHIAAGAIFLAAKFLKVQLPDGWWKDFEATPQQFEEVSNQLLELYEQNKIGASAGSGSGSGTPSATASRQRKALPSTPTQSNGHVGSAQGTPAAAVRGAVMQAPPQASNFSPVLRGEIARQRDADATAVDGEAPAKSDPDDDAMSLGTPEDRAAKSDPPGLDSPEVSGGLAREQRARSVTPPSKSPGEGRKQQNADASLQGKSKSEQDDEEQRRAWEEMLDDVEVEGPTERPRQKVRRLDKALLSLPVAGDALREKDVAAKAVAQPSPDAGEGRGSLNGVLRKSSHDSPHAAGGEARVAKAAQESSSEAFEKARRPRISDALSVQGSDKRAHDVVEESEEGELPGARQVREPPSSSRAEAPGKTSAGNLRPDSGDVREAGVAGDAGNSQSSGLLPTPKQGRDEARDRDHPYGGRDTGYYQDRYGDRSRERPRDHAHDRDRDRDRGDHHRQRFRDSSWDRHHRRDR